MHPALIVGIWTFSCSFGGALFGMLIGKLLPEPDVWERSREIIRVATAVVSTLAAVVVGLMLSSAQSSFAAKDNELKAAATQIILLDRTMAEYGAETREARALLKETVRGGIEAVWNDTRSDVVNPDVVKTSSGAVPVQRLLLGLNPKTEAQRWLRSSALEAIGNIEKGRWFILHQTNGSIQWPFLAILVFWFAIIFLSFGLYAPPNATVLLVLFACALSVASALYLIVQLDHPYRGFIQIPREPLQLALEQIDK